MPKRNVDFPVHLNTLQREGVREKLKAISYYRGDSGDFGVVARDFIEAGIVAFETSLSERERKRYAEILANVRVSITLRESGRRSSQAG
jgi:uncharacterized membrane protein